MFGDCGINANPIITLLRAKVKLILTIIISSLKNSCIIHYVLPWLLFSVDKCRECTHKLSLCIYSGRNNVDLSRY